MKMKFFTAVTLVCALTVNTMAFAESGDSATDKAVLKVQNVIDNNVAKENRQLLSDKLDAVSVAAAALLKAVDKLQNVANNNVPEKNKAPVLDKIQALKAAIAADLDVTVPAKSEPKKDESAKSDGQYCQAACVSSTGIPDLKYSYGVAGLNKILAQQAAETGVNAAYSCTYGVKLVTCEDSSSNKALWTCQYACTSSTGVADVQYAGVGQGGSKLEAGEKAATATQEKYSCTYGVAEITCAK